MLNLDTALVQWCICLATMIREVVAGGTFLAPLRAEALEVLDQLVAAVDPQGLEGAVAVVVDEHGQRDVQAEAVWPKVKAASRLRTSSIRRAASTAPSDCPAASLTKCGQRLPGVDRGGADRQRRGRHRPGMLVGDTVGTATPTVQAGVPSVPAGAGS